MAVMINGSPRTYTDEQLAWVIRHLDEHRDREHATTSDRIERECPIDERALRELFSDHDGHDFLLALDGKRLWWAGSAAEAEGFTARLDSQVDKMRRRVSQRKWYCIRFDTKQPSLF